MDGFSNITITLVDSNNTVIGQLDLFGVVRDVRPPEVNVSSLAEENDEFGAGMFVAVVLVVYSFSIMFLIASRTCIRHREHNADPQIQSAKHFFEQAPALRERNARDTYRKLKHSVIPVVAQSGSRDLVSRRKSFFPILAAAGLPHGSERLTSRAGVARRERLGIIDEIDESTSFPSTNMAQVHTFSRERAHRKRLTSHSVRVNLSPHLHSKDILGDVTSAYELSRKTLRPDPATLC